MQYSVYFFLLSGYLSAACYSALITPQDHNLHDGAPVPTISVPALLNNAEEAAIFRNYLVAKRKVFQFFFSPKLLKDFLC
jgi:hypothetical protein